MAKQVKRRRGSTAEHDVFTGAVGEITVDTDIKTAVVHDGALAGGYPLAKADLSNADLANKISVAELATTDGIAGHILTTDGSGQISFIAPGGVTPNSVGALELNTDDGLAGTVLTTDGGGTLNFSSVSVGVDELECVDGTAGQVLTTDGNATISFTSIDPSNLTVGGDLTGTVANAQIATDTINVAELNAGAGTSGQVLATNGSGDLYFTTNAGGGGAGGSSSFIENNFVGNNGTTFNLSIAAPTEESILVFLDGVGQPTTAYTLPTTTSIEFSSAPTIGQDIRVLHLGIASEILDNSITGAKLAFGADVEGDMLYYDGTDYRKLGIGTAGQSIATNSSATAPEWTTLEGVPSGIITMWSGAIAAIPSGWVICDGTNSTPDLRDRFVIGAGTTYAVDATGGSTSTAGATLSIAQLAAHTHTYSNNPATSEGGDNAAQSALQSTATTGSTGGGATHTHAGTLPPYYALAYIMKS